MKTITLLTLLLVPILMFGQCTNRTNNLTIGSDDTVSFHYKVDTELYLNNYITHSDTVMLAQYIRRADTATMLTHYITDMDKFNFYFDGNNWDTERTQHDLFSLVVHYYNDSQSMFIKNISMPGYDFTKLSDFIESLPDVMIGGFVSSYNDDTQEWELENFGILLESFNKEILSNKIPYMEYILEAIKQYYK